LRAWVVGVLFAVNTVMVTMLQLPVSRLLEQFRPVVVLVAGGLSYIALYAAAAFSELVPHGLRIGVLIAGTIVYTLGELAVSQAALVLLTGIPSPEDQGAYLSFNQVFVGGATALAPLLVTNLLAGQATTLWWVLSAVSVVSVLIVATDRHVFEFRNPSLHLQVSRL
jgi:MFS family permease